MPEHFAPLREPDIAAPVASTGRHSPLLHGPDPDAGGWPPPPTGPLTEPHVAPVANPLWRTGPTTGGSGVSRADRD